MYNWKFKIEDDQRGHGFGDAGAKHFKDAPLNNMVRETIQNSLDAPKANKDQTVTVTFEVSNIDGMEIPDCKGLQKVIKGILNNPKFIKKQHHPILEKMLVFSKKKKIPLLRIIEEGTLGMEGPCQIGKPLYDYMKSTGTGKEGANTKGSHGLGKGAPILNSRLNTIFVSTEFNGVSHVMGRTTLASREERGKVFSNEGYWGKDYKDVQFSSSLMPEWLKREGPGTNICVLGFKTPANWPELIVAASLISYFFAFSEGALVVKVIDEKGQQLHEINQSNVAHYFENRDVLNAAKNSSDISIKKLRLAKDFFIASQQKRKPSQTQNFGQIAFYCHEHEDERDARNIGFIRDDMFITDKVPYFPAIPKKYKPFCLIIDFEDEDGAQKIKAMEPPQHNEIKVTHLEDDDDRPEYENALKELKRKIIDFLDKRLQRDDWDKGSFAQLGEWLTVEVDEGNKSSDTDPLGRGRFKKIGPKIISPPLPVIIDPEPDDPEPDEPDGPQKVKRNKIEVKDFFYFKSGENSAELSFSVNYTGQLELTVLELGADQSRKLSISHTEAGSINKESNLLLDVKSGNMVDLNLTIFESGFNALKLELFKVQDAV